MVEGCVIGQVHSGGAGRFGLAVLLTLGKVMNAEGRADAHGRQGIGYLKERVAQHQHLIAMNGHGHMLVGDTVDAAEG